MASPVSRTPLTTAEYLAIERDAETKHEFFQGEMFAMSGASRRHNLLTLAIGSGLYNQLKHTGCEVYTSDMRVKVSSTGLYTYPDVVVVCDAPTFEDEHLDTLINPQAIVEVLSESTEYYDRGKKFEHYRQVDSLQDYLLVSQDRAHVERYSRTPQGWLLTEAAGIESSIALPAIDCTLQLGEVYAKIGFSDL